MENKNPSLVVVSKLKTHIKNTYGLSTSANVPPVLTQFIEELCQVAVQNAKNDGRKTVMDRDFNFLNNLRTQLNANNDTLQSVGNF